MELDRTFEHLHGNLLFVHLCTTMTLIASRSVVPQFCVTPPQIIWMIKYKLISAQVSDELHRSHTGFFNLADGRRDQDGERCKSGFWRHKCSWCLMDFLIRTRLWRTFLEQDPVRCPHMQLTCFQPSYLLVSSHLHVTLSARPPPLWLCCWAWTMGPANQKKKNQSFHASSSTARRFRGHDFKNNV